jgi:hypothetical protein
MLLEPIFGGRQIVYVSKNGDFVSVKLFVNKFDFIEIPIGIANFLVYDEVLVKTLDNFSINGLVYYEFNPKFVGKGIEYVGSIAVKNVLIEIQRKINLSLLGI